MLLQDICMWGAIDHRLIHAGARCQVLGIPRLMVPERQMAHPLSRGDRFQHGECAIHGPIPSFQVDFH